MQCPRDVEEPFPCGDMPPERIPTRQYFLLADNRPESEDSRLVAQDGFAERCACKIVSSGTR